MSVDKPIYVVANYSGGKDSTAMTLEWIERRERERERELYPLDEVVFCDTYMEFPQLLSEVEKVRQFVESKGIKFTRLQADTSFEYLLSEKPNNWKTEKYIYHDIDPQGLGWASPRARWCTRFLKTDVISKYFRELNKQYHVVNLIGIAADEKKRLERPGTSNKHNRYPLNEWGWTEGDCLQYCYDRGITWGGLYEHFNRVSCWCCPLQSLTDLREMYHCFPDLWSELKRLDNNQWRVFKQYDTVQSLEDRFKFEDERKANGLSIKNKEFFDELHKRCPPPEFTRYCYHNEIYQST